MTRGCIIIPVIDEASRIRTALLALQALREQGWRVIVVDGGSRDATVNQALSLADAVIVAPRGRASQMNAGAQLADGEVLVFLHIDTALPPTFELDMAAFVASQGRWGRFDVQLVPDRKRYRLTACMINLRSRLTGISTGDQVQFFRREFFRHVGGFPALPLMEDVAIAKRCKAVSSPWNLRARVQTSARRWEQHGWWQTTLLMWMLRAAFFLGVSPSRLRRWYGGTPDG